MKRELKKQNSKVNKKRFRPRQGSGPAVAFLLTFCAVVSVGVAGMLILKLFTSGWGDQKTFGFMDLGISSERIPEELEVEEIIQQSDSRYGAELSDDEYRKKNRIYAWESNSEDTVTFGFVGDFLLDDEYAIMASLLKRGAAIENGVSESMLTQMREVDIMVANNEFPFTDRGTPTPDKTFTFRADTGTVSYLHDMGVDVAVLANNHIYDFGEVGLLDTLDTLANAGIPQVGAGRNLEEASAPLYFIVNDMKIAVVAATQIERLDNPDTKGATESSAGVFRCWNPDKLYEIVAKAKANSDFVIVYIHWGTENQAEPDWAQLEQAPRIAQAGADLIIGDHSHCLQGITYCGDTPVIYSLGNFWFNSKSLDTCLVKVTIGQNGLEAFSSCQRFRRTARWIWHMGKIKKGFLPICGGCRLMCVSMKMVL